MGNENLRIQPNGLFELLISLNPLAIKGGEGTTERKCALTKCTNFPVSQMMNDGYRYKAKKNTFIRCRSIRQSVGPSIRPSHFWIAGSFCITAPAQLSATLLPCIRPCLDYNGLSDDSGFLCITMSLHCCNITLVIYNTIQHILNLL